MPDLVDSPRKALSPLRSGWKMWRNGGSGGQVKGREEELWLVYKIKSNFLIKIWVKKNMYIIAFISDSLCQSWKSFISLQMIMTHSEHIFTLTAQLYSHLPLKMHVLLYCMQQDPTTCLVYWESNELLAIYMSLGLDEEIHFSERGWNVLRMVPHRHDPWASTWPCAHVHASLHACTHTHEKQ